MDPQPGPPQPDHLIGQTIGNYLVTQKLGEGGMGSVYLAEHPSIGKKVALKVLHPEFSTNQEVAQRFFHEAKAVNDIGHPNIVDIVDFGVLQGANAREQLVYFIMEYLAGLTLSQLIAAEAPLPPERALGIGLQVADALSASHRCGIVHRDLKPDNIILSQRGRERDFVKLLDFGIAKLTGGSATGSHRTRSGLVIGTPAYMSPEQCEGASSVDKRTDIYALGVVLYEMMTGRVPFVGNGYSEVLIQHLTQPPPPPSSFRMIPPHVEIVVLKALEKRADLRYPTMDEFLRAMADPVGYVEAHGGVAGFLQRPLMPSSTPLPAHGPLLTSGFRMTPSPQAQVTPLPGALVSLNLPSSPGIAPPGRATTQHTVVERAAHRRRTLYIAVGATIVALAAGMVVVVASGGKAVAPPASAGSAVGGTDPAGRPAAPDLGSAAVSPGSAAVVAAGSGSGSAVQAAGSGSAEVAAAAPANAEGSASPSAGSADERAPDPAPPEPDPTPPAPPVDSKKPSRVSIDVSSYPAGAKILVDNVDTNQTTPSTVKISRERGKRATITLRLKGYNTFTRAVDLSDGSQVTAELSRTRTTAPAPGPGSAARPPAKPPAPPTQPAPDPDGLIRP